MIWVQRFLVLSVLAAAVATGWLLLKSPVMQLKAIEIELDPKSKDALLFDRIHSGLQASLSRYIGLPFWKIPLDQVMADIKRDQRVADAQIQREFPHHMRVMVVPKKPLLAYMDRAGKVYPIASDASLMPALSLKDMPDFPLMRGDDFYSDMELREHALKLMESIPSEGRFQRAMVSEVLHSKDGFSLFLAGQAVEIKMGDSEFDLKVSRVEKVLTYLHNRGLKSRIIDARFAKKVVVRVRK